MQDLNLARRPFLNVRPVKRFGLLLLAVGLLLLAVNAVLYWGHFTGEGKTRSRSQDLGDEIASEQEAIRLLESEIEALDISDLNRRTRFINGEIDRRRFGWSRLFDRVATVQPRAVRLVSLMPRFGENGGSRRRARIDQSEVSLGLRGVAKNGGVLLALIDNLFEHPAFRNPDISREARREDGSISFVLSVLYLPDVDDAEPSAEAPGESSGESPDEPSDGPLGKSASLVESEPESEPGESE